MTTITSCALLTPAPEASPEAQREALEAFPAGSKRKQVRICYGKPATVLRLYVKPDLYETIKQTSEYLGNPSGLDFSMSIIGRRALEKYAEVVSAMSKQEVRTEAKHLCEFYR